MTALERTQEKPFDVIAIGEVLVEVATDRAFVQGAPATLGFSGDALNVAAAAAAAGARVGLLAALTDDELGDAIVERIASLGIATELLVRRPGQQGVYLVHGDPDGEREFSYARRGSVGASIGVDDIDAAVLREAGAVVASGISCAISESARSLVHRAAEEAQRFVFDPNFRPRLTSPERAAEELRDLARSAYLVTPSFPGETRVLLGEDTALDAARLLHNLGTPRVAVTCGAQGVQLLDGAIDTWIDAVPAATVVDQTGAGDSFVGTLTARLVLGDRFEGAARLAAAAASLVVGGRGGTGIVPTLDDIRAHAGAIQ